jgi:hypothetical protein
MSSIQDNREAWVNEQLRLIEQSLEEVPRVKGFILADTEKLFEARVQLRLILTEMYNRARKGSAKLA